MEPSLTLSETNTLMDIAFLFHSVRDPGIMSHKFLQMLGKIVPYEKAAVFLYQQKERQFFSCADIRCERAMLTDYVEKYCALDYLGWQIFQTGSHAFRESDKIQVQDRNRTRFYLEFLKKYNISYRLILSAVSSAGELLSAAMLFRSNIFEDFSDREVAMTELLHNHFSIGVENSIQLEELTRREHVAQAVYQALPDVVLILDEQFRIQESNDAAQQYLERLNGQRAQKREFFQEIQNACHEMGGNSPSGLEESLPPESKTIFVSGGRAQIHKIIRHTLQGGVQAEYVVVFSAGLLAGVEPERQESDTNIWKAQFYQALSVPYGLTKRESDLIALALEGLENQEIAEKLHISLFTVKSHFQNSYAKLSVKSRQELFLIYMKYSISEKFRQEFNARKRKDDFQ